MGDEELTGYIIRSREKGRTKEQIIRALYSVGWKKEKVETAFQKLDGSKNWQKDGTAQPPQTQQQGKVNEPNAATPQQMQMLQQSRQQKQSAPAPAAVPTQPETQPTSQSQPPIDLQAPKKKPLFVLPALFQKKQPSQQPGQAQQITAEKKPFAIPMLFGKKSGSPAPAQPSAQQSPPPSQMPLPQSQPAQQIAPQKPVQAAQPPPPPAVKEITTQPAAKEAERQVSSDGMKAAPGLLPPKTTFTVSTQQVSFGTAQATAKTAPAGNPAFSNLASAAASAAGRKSFLPSVVLAAILLLAIGYYFFQMRSPTIPQVDGPRIELNKTNSKTANTTKPPVLQNTTKKPVVTPPKNTTKTNVSQPAAKQNATAPAKNSTPAAQNTSAPAKNTTPSQPSNASAQQGNQSGTQRFSSHSTFYSSESDPPSKFCQSKNAALYRVHYFEYYGTNCLNDKNKEGYSFPIDFPYACDSIPCCYNDVSSSFSRKFDSFECGYYES